MVLIAWQHECKRRYDMNSFRPLAGIMVLITSWAYLYSLYDNSFRPLAGIMVLIVFVKHSFV